MNYEYMLQRIIETEGGIEAIYEKILVYSAQLQRILTKMAIEKEDKSKYFDELLETFALIDLYRDILMWHNHIYQEEYNIAFAKVLDSWKRIIKK